VDILLPSIMHVSNMLVVSEDIHHWNTMFFFRICSALYTYTVPFIHDWIPGMIWQYVLILTLHLSLMKAHSLLLANLPCVSIGLGNQHKYVPNCGCLSSKKIPRCFTLLPVGYGTVLNVVNNGNLTTAPDQFVHVILSWWRLYIL
jgi:hypothetical protein